MSTSFRLFVCGGFSMLSLLRNRNFFFVSLFFLCFPGGGWSVSLFNGWVVEADFCLRLDACSWQWFSRGRVNVSWCM